MTVVSNRQPTLSTNACILSDNYIITYFNLAQPRDLTDANKQNILSYRSYILVKLTLEMTIDEYYTNCLSFMKKITQYG